MGGYANSGESESWFCFFFFQAEDGIRDLTVTGVQTCALPIYHGQERRAADGPEHAERPAAAERSEERRVGKEGRCRGWPVDDMKRQLKVCTGTAVLNKS